MNEDEVIDSDIVKLTVEEIYRLVSVGDKDRAIDLLFERVDDLIGLRWWSSIDHMLARLDPDQLGTSLCVGTLSITLWVKCFLKERPRFLERVEEYFSRVCPERAERLLDGLR